jgi:hypothetical protein
VPTLSGQVGNPASIERDRPGLDCGGTELRTFLLGQRESICYRRGGDRGTISTGDRQGGGSMHAGRPKRSCALLTISPEAINNTTLLETPTPLPPELQKLVGNH